MKLTRTRFVLCAVLCSMSVGCGGDDDDSEAWRDFYSPEWSQGSQPSVPAPTLAVPPAAVEVDPELAPGPEGPVALEPVDNVPELREDAPLVVKRGESLKLYAKWSGHSVDELMTMMGLQSQRIRAGQRLEVSFSPSTWKQFQRNRQAHRQNKETEFFARFHVQDLVPYKVKKGDSVWKIAKKHGKLPLWLLEKFNQRHDLGKLRPGMELLIPKLVPLADAGKKAGQDLWKPSKKPARQPYVAVKPGRRATPPPIPARRSGGGPAEVDGDLGGIDEGMAGMNVRARKGETLRLYARWAGCLVREIKMVNPGLSGTLREGQSVFVPMAENRTTSFLRKRNDHTRKQNQSNSRARNDGDRRAPERSQMTRYKVKRGDTAWKIADKRGFKLSDLRKANPDKNLNRLRVGDTIYIPKRRR